MMGPQGEKAKHQEVITLKGRNISPRLRDSPGVARNKKAASYRGTKNATVRKKKQRRGLEEKG